MNDKYKISIIVPIYNIEKYLYNCLISVVNQTLENIQVILVNDGSTDNSGQIAMDFSEKYDDFKVVYQKNSGLGEARNCGLKYVKGKYILFLDGDDMLPPKTCEVMYKKAQVKNSDIVIGKPVWKYDDGTTKPVQYLSKWFKKDLTLNYRNNIHIARGFPITTSKLFRASLIINNKLKFPKNITGEDVVYSIYTFHKAKRIHIIPDVVYWRTERKDSSNLSIMQQKSIKIVKDRLEVIKLIDKYCDDNYLERIKKHNRKATFNYILRIIPELRDMEQKRKAYKLLKEFIDNHFINKNEIRKYINLTYNDIKKKLLMMNSN